MNLDASAERDERESAVARANGVVKIPSSTGAARIDDARRVTGRDARKESNLRRRGGRDRVESFDSNDASSGRARASWRR